MGKKKSHSYKVNHQTMKANFPGQDVTGALASKKICLPFLESEGPFLVHN
jgi:hypothetical protein